MHKLLRSVVLVPAMALVLIGCAETTNPVDQGPGAAPSAAQSLDKPGGKTTTGANTILDIAKGNPNFSILVQAIQFAGLEGALSGKRQFTVFAPTNQAFVNLLDRLDTTPEELFVEANKPLVTSILLYHVAPGFRSATDVLESERVNTLRKEFIFVKTGPPQVGNMVNGYADIVATDIFASNGVIHVIDDVIVQPSVDVPNIVD